ncbi:protein kinase [Rhodococcus sp. NCIMB 12038]|uniref:protein kinase domain-containing protein n=1 Tax=Rhodococcus sp. NCIMB 12038 TaxID=933800 RepID=UPI000B3CAC20|nr:protein kinase [Rhodococcus sp. NCIMB 12038]OUS92926.1 protein kinase [Rhodococcus sp. NCIMB 12038]
MTDSDPLRTRRDVTSAVTDMLTGAGFDAAVEIGRGGFGAVYRCTQVSLDRVVAVKVLTGELDDESRARFFHEQRAMGQLTGHPNIVSVLQVGATESGVPYIVMPYHPENSLDARIRRHGPLTVEEGLRLGVKLSGALETAHHLGIVHRDVKPANILLTDYGEPELTDFGIAHVAGGFRTAPGTVVGSPAFTAPEVLGGQTPTPSADVYGLGATLFCALTGHAAFERRSGEQIVAQFLRITTQPVPDLRETGIPDDVSAIVEVAMAADPDDRPSAAGLGEILQRVQSRNGFPVDSMALKQAEPDHAQKNHPPVPLVASGRPSFRHSVGSSTPGRKGNLVLELTSFVGRRTELATAKNLLASSRLVTLTGVGGVGKTRLGLRVASTAQRDYPDGVWLVELSELRDGSLLTNVLANTLGLRPQSSRQLPDVLVEYLAPRKILLLLDNCEQVLDAAMHLADTLLRECADLRILVTSREPLGLGGEVVYRVCPLAVPEPDREPSLRGLPRYDAVTLFVERASVAVPGFVLTEANKATVARICARLDGLPLAIELAAARLRAMSPEQILQRLTNRYQLLTRGSRSAPTRQQTLRSCIAGSYDLCTAVEQQLWAEVSVFAGSFALDAVEDVCASTLGADAVLDAVASLVDKSILIRVEQSGVVRFHLLETLREYGWEKVLHSGESTKLALRHRAWCRKLALDAEAGWVSPQQLSWIDRLDREERNLREALEFCLSEPDESAAKAGLEIAAALFPFWLTHGRLDEGRRWLDRVLARQRNQPASIRVKALHAASFLAVIQGDFLQAATFANEGRALAADHGTQLDHALVQHADGARALLSGDPRAAVPAFTQALTVLRDGGNQFAYLTTMQVLGMAHELLGHFEEARGCLEQAIRISEQHGESVLRGRASWTLALAVWREGESDRAVTLLGDGLRLVRQVDDPLGAAWCLEILAWIEAQNQPRRATVLMAAAAALRRRVGTSTDLASELAGYREECTHVARLALGERSFAGASHEGELMDIDAAVAYALGTAPTAAEGADTMTVLTKRERQVADLVARGLTNKAIADQLVISQRTAQGHVEHILTKLGFTSRTQIAAWVVEQHGDPR